MPVSDISPRALNERLQAGEAITVIDVREDWELQISKLDFALHILMYDIPDSLEQIPRDKPVVIMCHVGGRSSQVATWLHVQGYTNVLNLTGGINGWAREVDPSLTRY
jgi:rhodanese-related sulfurtransferase